MFGDGGTCVHAFDDPNCWSGFGTAGLHPNGSFRGGGFDGRYVYFVSSGSATANWMTRYDTSAAFGSAAAWSAFNLSSIDATTPAFFGAAFDGRYLYAVPCDPGFGSVLHRYDTRASFGSADAWSAFDMAAVNGINPSYDGQCDIGGVFDGRYVYFVPNSIYEYWEGTVARYDTQGGFSDVAGSWATFNTQMLADTAAGFMGAAFDGRYVYFVPWGDASTGTPLSLQGPPLMTRYDTQATFTNASAWSTFDPRVLGPTNVFAGAAFDGRYVYFPPNDYRGIVTRYDTAASFTASSSWSVFPLSGLAAGLQLPFNGARFDGRYLYLIPGGTVTVRYDTTAPFADSASWQTVDLASLDKRAGAYEGGVFDGRYLYLVPAASNLVLRFDARAAAPLPQQSAASFF